MMKNQVSLVIQDSTALGPECLLLWAHANYQLDQNMVKESEIDELLASLNGFRISDLLACH